MDPTAGPFSWLSKILGMNPQGGSQFGALGGGLNGSQPSPAVPPAASGGMPMSGLGPGAPSGPAGMLPNGMRQPFGMPTQLTPGPGQGQPANNNSPGLWNGGNSNQIQNLAQSLMKPAQLTPAQFSWMPMGRG